MNPQQEFRRGIALSLGAAMANAFFLVPFRRATEYAHQEPLVLVLLLSAAVFNTTAQTVLGERGTTSWTRWSRVELAAALALTVFSIAGNVTGAEAIARLTPAVASVMLQTQVLFAALFGWLLLGERVHPRFVLGALLAIGGIVIMRAGDGTLQVELEGTLWGLASGTCFGMMQVVSRKYVRSIRPVAVNALRLWLSVALLAMIPGRVSAAIDMRWEGAVLIAAAAFAGPFLGRLCLLYSTKYVSAATSTLLGLAAPLFTLLLGFALLGDWPSGHELAGGAVVVVGMLLALRR